MSLSDECNYYFSAQFLSKALGNDWEIDSFKVTNGTKPGDNFMSAIYNIEVNCKDKEGNPFTRHLLIKCYPSHPGRQKFFNKTNIFFKELEIYQVLIPELKRFQTEVVGLETPIPLPFAPFVHGECIDFESAKENELTGRVLHSTDNYLLMEDVRKTHGFLMRSPKECLDLQHMKLVIYELAKMHALSWAYKNWVEMDVSSKFRCLVKVTSPESAKMWIELSNSSIDEAITALNETLGTVNPLSKALLEFKRAVPTILKAFRGFSNEDALDSLLRVKNEGRFGKDVDNPEPWRVIGHGDCWSNNLLFKYDKTEQPIEAMLVDLPLVKEICIVHDLVNIIYISTSSSLRKNYIYELMELYFNTFNDFCKILKTSSLPGFTMEAFKYRFHRFKLVGLLMAILTFPMTLKAEEKYTNVESAELDVNASNKIFTEFCQLSEADFLYKIRIQELVQEMYEEGII